LIHIGVESYFAGLKHFGDAGVDGIPVAYQERNQIGDFVNGHQVSSPFFPSAAAASTTANTMVVVGVKGL